MVATLDAMILHPPFEISPRLLPGLQIGGAWLHLEYAQRRGADGRTVYRYTIDLPGRKRGIVGTDLRSGIGGENLQQGFGSLLSFIGACGEAWYWAQRDGRQPGECADLFPKAVGLWASDLEGNRGELSSLGEQIEARGVVLIEE